MLTEDQVIGYFCDYLIANGYEVRQALSTKEKGIDVIAEKDGMNIKAEAKGATSALTTSNRYGIEFSKNQVRNHVSVGLSMISKLMTKDNDYNIDYAFVLPDNNNHINEIESIRLVIRRLCIKVFFVNEDGGVREFI
ncbi:hypothetical protein KQI38_08895 [Tissierella carlieri]|uniref:hypothetical protein n=1 Tax=Tissierella carlieri TaxID=689904 RepID=UPI001C11F564|nr:hypothetical protein [Tissierella carlieri]MBU5312141.1 hypothetical protein [Tissierella carlieri]